MFLLILFIMASFYIPTAKESSLSVPLNVGSVYRSSSPPQRNAWVGSAITAGASLLGGLFGNRQQNKNINKQIQAQQEENQKNREYNLMLAQQQNAWNVEQWERENEYNSPEKQMERMRKVKVNPDLYVGGGAQNLSASSPAMTAGAASTATDMSALGQKPTLGQAIQTALRDSMLGAQIDNIKANTKKTLADAGISQIQLEYEDAKQKLGIDISKSEFEKLQSNIEEAFYNAREAAYRVEGANYDMMSKRIEYLYKEREMKALINDIEAKAKISQNEAEYLSKTLLLRILGFEAETDMKRYESQFKVIMSDQNVWKDIISVYRLIKDNK